MPQDALQIMLTPLNQQLQKPLTFKQQWVESVEAVIARKQQHDHGAMVGEQCLM